MYTSNHSDQIENFLNSMTPGFHVVDTSIPGIPAATKTCHPDDVIDWFHNKVIKELAVVTYIPGEKLHVVAVDNPGLQRIFKIKVAKDMK